MMRNATQCTSTIGYKSPQEVYLPSAYTQSEDLEVYFGDGTGTWFVDAGYLKGSSDVPVGADEYREALRKAFVSLGVFSVPRRKPIPNATLSDAFKLSLRSDQRPVTSEEVEDYTLDGLNIALERIAVEDEEARRVSCALWRLLVRVRSLWRQGQTHFGVGTYRWVSRFSGDRKFQSNADTRLHNSKWIIADDGSFRSPKELYIPDAETRQVLGPRARFPHPDLGLKDNAQSPERVLAVTLAVKANVDVAAALEHLQDLSGSTPDVNAVAAIYSFLLRHSIRRPEELILFRDKALLYTPTPEPRWWKASEAFWQSERTAFGDDRGYLEEHYPLSLRSFFVSISVPESASFPDYVRALLDLSREDARNEAVRTKSHILYDRLWSQLRKPAATAVPGVTVSQAEVSRAAKQRESWRKLLGASCWLGCKSYDQWAWFERNSLYLNDHDHNTALFADRLPFWVFPDLSDLARFAELTAASQAHIEFIPDNEQVEQIAWSEKVRQMAGHIGTFLTSPRLVGERFNLNPLDFLSRLLVVMVPRGNVLYTLGGVSVLDPNPLASHLDVASDGTEAVLWITAEAKLTEVADLIGDALALHFGEMHLGTFVSRLLTTEDETRVLAYWQKLGLRYEAPAPVEGLANSSAVSEDASPVSIHNVTGGVAETRKESSQDTTLIDSANPDDYTVSPNADAEMSNNVTNEHSINSATNTPLSDEGSSESASGQPTVSRTGAPNGSDNGSTTCPTGYRATGSNTSRNYGYGRGYGGGGEGDTHKALKALVRDNPGVIGPDLRFMKEEYNIAGGHAGSEIDVLLKDVYGRPIAVECKPHISSGDYSPVWQATRYKHLLAVEHGMACADIRAVLVAPKIPPDVQAKCSLMGVEVCELVLPSS